MLEQFAGIYLLKQLAGKGYLLENLAGQSSPLRILEDLGRRVLIERYCTNVSSQESLTNRHSRGGVGGGIPAAQDELLVYFYPTVDEDDMLPILLRLS